MSKGLSNHFEAAMKLYNWTRAGGLKSKGPACPRALAERGQLPKVISKAIQSSTQVVPRCPLPLPRKTWAAQKDRRSATKELAPRPSGRREWPVGQSDALTSFAGRGSYSQSNHLGPGHPPPAIDRGGRGLGGPHDGAVSLLHRPGDPHIQLGELLQEADVEFAPSSHDVNELTEEGRMLPG